MERIRTYLPAAGLALLLAVCCGGKLVLVAVAVAAGAGVLGTALLGPGLGVAALLAIVGVTALLARRLLRIRRGSTSAECCDAAPSVRSRLTKEASAR